MKHSLLGYSVAVTLVGCSSSAKFSNSSTAVTPVVADAPATAIQTPTQTPTAAPTLPPPVVLPVKDYSIKYAIQPISLSNSVTEDFAIVGTSEDVQSALYVLDDAKEVETPGAQFTVFSFYGDHKISIRARFKDGSLSSNTLTHQWHVDAGGFRTLGNAIQAEGSEYRLTESKTSQAGMVVSDNKLIFRWVEMNFGIQFSNAQGTEIADGIVFGITEKASNDITIGGGGSMGFFGTSGFGVEFDNYKNSWDPDANHIALIADDEASHTEHHASTPISLPELRTQIGKWFDVKVCVAPGGLFSVVVDGRKLIDKTQMPGFPAGRNFDGHIFLSAATGASWVEQRVRMKSVRYNVVGEPESCQ